jgi:broad specificity phosphatase PhoE
MRHAAVAYVVDGQPVRVDDVSLTDEGRTQAQAAATALDGFVFDRVVTSGLPRTVETARIVVPDVEPEHADAFREMVDDRHEWVVRAVNFAPYDALHTRSRRTTMEELWAEFSR